MDATSRNERSPGSTVRDGARETGPVLEAWYRFLLWLVSTLERLLRRQKLVLGDHIQNAALDVLECLIEATYTRRREAHLARANLGIEKLRFLVRLTMNLEYLDPRPRRDRTKGRRLEKDLPRPRRRMTPLELEPPNTD